MEINNKIGITGGRGFIGSNLIKLLKRKKIPYVLFEGDLLNKKDMESFFIKEKSTIVIHLAGRFFGTPKQLYRTNVVTTANLLSFGVKHGLKKIIYASTGGIYGEPLHNTGSKENDKPNPNTPYAKSKLQAEKIVQIYRSKYKLKTIILRFPNIYGQGHKQGVVHDLFQSIQNNKRMVIFGDGNQRRQFLNVNDACEAIILALKHGRSDVFNITNAREYSINEIVKYLQKRYKFTVQYSPPNNNLKQLKLNPSKSEKLLHFITTHRELTLSI